MAHLNQRITFKHWTCTKNSEMYWHSYDFLYLLHFMVKVYYIYGEPDYYIYG